jgi:hypothetical protein
MPVREGNLLRGGRDAIPKKLNKIDTFIDGKLVESWRWRRDLLGHSEYLLRFKYIENYGW